MTADDVAIVRRFAEALPERPFGGPILRVLAELERLQRATQTIDNHTEATIMTGTQWIRSSRCSGGDCVEVAWQKSTHSSGGTCVEVAALPPTAADPACQTEAPHDGHVLVRDSKDPDGPRLRFTCTEWAAFLAGVKDGEFDHLAGPA